MWVLLPALLLLVVAWTPPSRRASWPLRPCWHCPLLSLPAPDVRVPEPPRVIACNTQELFEERSEEHK